MYVTEALRRQGFVVELLDYQLAPDAKPFNVDAFTLLIESTSAELVGISLFGDGLPLVLAAIADCQRAGSEKRFVLGGPGVNGSEHDLLRRFPSIFAVVRGEGEMVTGGIIRAFRSGTMPSTAGVFTRAGDGTIVGSEPHRMKDLDAVPWPDYDRLDVTPYETISVVTSRGCPFNCSFCEIITMWGRSVGYRDTANVVAELTHIVRTTGRRRFDFIDDTFTVRRLRVLELCDAIVGAGLDISWSCFSRIDTIDPELMCRMSEAGCSSVFFGIDTGSELMWRGINKRLSRDRVLDVVGESLRWFNVTPSYIWGYPDEHYDDFADTVTLAFEVARLPRHGHRARSQLHFLSPTRSTPIFKDHSDKLEFSETVRLEICGSPLSNHQYTPGYEKCLALIKSDPAVFAPYYYYRSPDLERKFATVHKASVILEELVGAAMFEPEPANYLQQSVAALEQRARADTDDGLADMIAFVTLTHDLARLLSAVADAAGAAVPSRDLLAVGVGR